MRFPRRPPVEVIYLAIEFIWRPDWGVETAAGHAVGAQEDVAGVPDHEGEGDEQPVKGQAGGCVRPGLGRCGGGFGGGGLARRGGLGWGYV